MIDKMTIAELAARTAGTQLKLTMNDIHEARQKGAIDDMVSAADLVSDRVITRVLEQTGFNILSEEQGYTDNKSPYTWVVDSLDGTANYLNHIPYFGVSIGLTKGNTPIGGVIYDPVQDAMFSAFEDKGAHANGKPLVLTDKDMASSILNSDFGRGPKEESTRLIGELVGQCRYLRICGSAVMAMADVAIGRSQAYVHFDLKPWDGCAGAVIIQEAGGVVTNKKGEPWSLNDQSFFAASPLVHKKIMELIQSKEF